MKKLLLILTLFLSIQIYAQEEQVIADETVYVPSKKTTTFAIKTANFEIGKAIFERYKKKELKGFTGSPKRDRNGKYWEISFRFDLECKDEVVNFIKEKFK